MQPFCLKQGPTLKNRGDGFCTYYSDTYRRIEITAQLEKPIVLLRVSVCISVICTLNGLQNLYSSVRFRSPPPVLTSLTVTTYSDATRWSNQVEVCRKTLKVCKNLSEGKTSANRHGSVDENKLERLELSAIIYEYSETNGIVFAHPLTDLKADGTFS